MAEPDSAHYGTVIENHQVHLIFPFNHRARWGWRVLNGWRGEGLLQPEADLSRLFARQPWDLRKEVIEDFAPRHGQRRRAVLAIDWLGTDLTERLGQALKEGTAPETAWNRDRIVIRGLHAHMPSALGH